MYLEVNSSWTWTRHLLHFFNLTHRASFVAVCFGEKSPWCSHQPLWEGSAGTTQWPGSNYLVIMEKTKFSTVWLFVSDQRLCCDLTRMSWFILCSLAGARGKIWVSMYLLLLSLCIPPLLRIQPLLYLHHCDIYPCTPPTPPPRPICLCLIWELVTQIHCFPLFICI